MKDRIMLFIRKRGALQWTTLLVICVLFAVRIKFIMYVVQVAFVVFSMIEIYKRIKTKKEILPQGQCEYLYFYIVFTVLSILSVFWTSNLHYTFSSIKSIIQVFVVCFLIFVTCNEAKNYYDIVNSFSVIGWVIIVHIVIATSLEQWKEIFAQNTNLSSDACRLGPSIGMHPNECGAILSVLIVFSFYNYIKKKKIANLFQLILLTACLMFTKSRMSIIAVIFAMGLYFVISMKSRKKRIISAIISFFIMGLLLVLSIKIDFLYNLYGNRIESLFFSFKDIKITDASVRGRLKLMKYALEVFKEHPVFGVGIGNFRSYSGTTHGLSGRYAHNNYLELMADVGAVGVLLYYIPFLICLFRTIKATKQSDIERRNMFNLFLVQIIMRLLSDVAQVSYLYDFSQIVLVLSFIGLKFETLPNKNEMIYSTKD